MKRAAILTLLILGMASPPQGRASPDSASSVSAVHASDEQTSEEHSSTGGALKEASQLAATLNAAPPNIVLLIGDDYGWPDYGFMGSKFVQTPNLDRLAAEGIVFTHGFATASVCRPSLRSLLTGLQPAQWRAARRAHEAGGEVRADTDWIERFAPLPQLLAARGYVSFQGGKFWEGPYTNAGFDAAVPAEAEVQRRERKPSSALGGVFVRETMQPLWDFLDAHRGQPFFIWFAPKLPHAPFDPPEEIMDRYSDHALSREALTYYANCSRFDDAVGELLAYLDRTKQRENTLIVYLADNGWEQTPGGRYAQPHIGGPRGKLSLYELGVRTPMVFVWPGRIRAGRRSAELVSAVDLYPTFLTTAGLDVPAGRSGLNLWPYLDGEEAGPLREFLIGASSGLRHEVEGERAPDEAWMKAEQGYYFRSPQWRYMWYPARQEDRLFEIQEDPFETDDLSDRHPEKRRAFRRHIEAWQIEMSRVLELESGPKLMK